MTKKMGRPVQEKTKVAVSVTLDQELIEEASSVGEGNISRGMTIIIKRYMRVREDLQLNDQTQDHADLLS